MEAAQELLRVLMVQVEMESGVYLALAVLLLALACFPWGQGSVFYGRRLSWQGLFYQAIGALDGCGCGRMCRCRRPQVCEPRVLRDEALLRRWTVRLCSKVSRR